MAPHPTGAITFATMAVARCSNLAKAGLRLFSTASLAEITLALVPAGLIMGSVGNLYGTTFNGGSDSCSEIGCGTVFRLSSNILVASNLVTAQKKRLRTPSGPERHGQCFGKLRWSVNRAP